jgi:hypothetical protein
LSLPEPSAEDQAVRQLNAAVTDSKDFRDFMARLRAIPEV